MVVLLLAPPSHSAIYKWKDDNGKTHFTDDVSKIPVKYREKDELEKMDGALGDPSDPVQLNIPKKKASSGAIPFEPYGDGHFIVEALINGRIKARLIVDTGASMVVLSDRVGKLLNVSGKKDFPTLQVNTAGGRIESPLFILDSIKIGHAKQFGVEASTNPHFKNKGVDGLLGMSFLGEFKLEVDHTNQKIFLKPLAKRGEMSWGEHNEAWWRNKYATYVGHMRKLRNYIGTYKMSSKEYINKLKMIEHYSKLHAILEKRANEENLPKEFRIYP